jgi:thymidylate synthase ThyX
MAYPEREMPDLQSDPAATPLEQAPEHSQNLTEVFAVHGADPEVLAYAMARYSRSALSMKESLKEISSQRAEQFLNTFYFQYGHRSIADLAHIAFAIERLSLLAAIVLVDEQRWDGQERSTRYQNFRKSGWFLPSFGPDSQSQARYTGSIEASFAAYHQVADGMLEALKQQISCPEEMKPETYTRTLRARAFDVARYLLPLATNTSLGQIVNARTLETQISRLLSHPTPEVQNLGERLREAAASPAWCVNRQEMAALQHRIAEADPELADECRTVLLHETRPAPTLVKYATPSYYQQETRRELRQAASEIMGQTPIADAPLVDLVEKSESLEAEIAATLLYAHSHYPYRQLRDAMATLGQARCEEVIDLGIRHRGRHDELLREFSAGQALRFDILMDIGGFRDMHRHRRCTQILQDFTPLHGYAEPEGLTAELAPIYRQTLDAAHALYSELAASPIAETAAAAPYLLPLGTRTRALFKMDFAEALYISELRSAPQGHFSYRRVAWEMYLAVQRKHPALAEHFRVCDPDGPIDLLKR